MSKGTPLIGGIAIGLAFTGVYLLAIFASGGLSRVGAGVLVASFVMLIFGLIDDFRELSVFSKFLAQMVAAFVLLHFDIRTKIIYVSPAVNTFITIVWVIGITNAFNHLDIIDGLAAGAAIIISLSFFAIASFNADIQMQMISAVLTGAVFGFLLFNLPPARIYMGNTGSHYLGFIFAAIALIISYAPENKAKIALMSPLLVSGFLIFDTAFLIVKRLINKRSPFKKSNDHLVFQFLARGYTLKRAVFTMYALCALFCISGIMLSQSTNALGSALIAVVVCISGVIAIRYHKVPVHE